MKFKTLIALLLLASQVIYAQTEPWQDPKVNEINRAPMHSTYFAFESAESAETGCMEKSANFLSLNGTWNFNWVEHAWQRPTDCFGTDFNDKGWDKIQVPAMWELNGYGDPIYVNVGYAWRNQYRNNPPVVPEENNHVGTYRKEIEVPASWDGKKIFAHFGSVTSNITLYVNGKFVGYSEDSKLEAEFDLTKYLKPGKNLIAFQVFRWSDGSYLEDQDFWRFSGVGRDCYLYSRNASYLQDIKITPDLDADYVNGSLSVALNLVGKGSVDLALTDATGNTVVEKSVNISGESRTELSVTNPAKWTAETPVLYKLTATVKSGDKILEVIPVKVGFRKVEMLNGQLCVNGKAILVKGVNRHELDPDGGYVVSRERMIQDIEMMKKFNVNAVRTCHYPDNSTWYDLCDEYGIYMVAEANIESHGMGYGPQTLAKNEAFDLAHLQRNQRNVLRNFNHPAVIVWSLGNEAGFGPNFEACYTWIKDYDHSRPVQYEQAHGNEYSDIFCPMYYPNDRCDQYGQKDTDKPLIQCEYAHAMGNSMGGFKEYWDLIRKYPNYQGGFIWDFVDQSIHWKNKDGQPIYAYGGDFNPYDASDNNFLDNGLISPDRVPNPHYYEVGYFYQSIWTTPVDLKKGTVEVYNEYFFRDLSNFYLDWELVADGNVIETGTVSDLKVAPHQKATIDLGLSVPANLKANEVFINVAYKLKEAEGPVPAGYTLSKDQLEVKAWEFEALEISNKHASNQTVNVPTIKENDYHYLRIIGENFSLDFNKQNGFLSHYIVNGKAMLVEGSQLVPNFWRAPTDNDFGARLQRRYRIWHNPEMKLNALDATEENQLVKVAATYEMPDISGQLELQYIINNAGEIKVTQKLIAGDNSEVSDMFRFGMKLEMPKAYSNIEYYGRGPVENYVDRKYSEFIGIYNQDVCEQFYPYIRPQETGTKSDIRWWKQANISGSGLKFISDAAFSASALNYTVDALDDGLDKDQRHAPEVPKSDFVTVCIDKVQMGLGCINSWGYLPLEQYRIPYQNYEFSFMISPVKLK